MTVKTIENSLPHFKSHIIMILSFQKINKQERLQRHKSIDRPMANDLQISKRSSKASDF